MEFLLAGILAVASLIFVAFPLINREDYARNIGDLFDSGEDKKASDLHAKKAVVDVNVQELEIEHEMGKLSDGDFELLRERLLVESGELDAEIEKHKIRREIDVLIEHEVRRRRRSKDKP